MKKELLNKVFEIQSKKPEIQLEYQYFDNKINNLHSFPFTIKIVKSNFNYNKISIKSFDSNLVILSNQQNITKSTYDSIPQIEFLEINIDNS